MGTDGDKITVTCPACGYPVSWGGSGARVVLLLIVALTAAAPGCAARPYLLDRVADAADTVTACIGNGVGAKTRIGPIGAGLLVNFDGVGLRGGEFLAGFDKENSDFTGIGAYCLVMLCELSSVRSEETFGLGMPRVVARNKACRKATAFSLPFPQIWFLEARSAYGRWHYYSQIEIVGGVWYTVRLGINPAEIVDFILGWTTLDIFNDDIARRRTL